MMLTALAIAITLDLADAQSADTFSRFPDEQTCEAMHALSVAWAESIRQDARELGYYGPCAEDVWGVRRDGWLGGGQHAQQMRDELAECERRRLVIWSVWWIRWHKVSDADRAAWSERLKGQIGPAAWCRGEMPCPVPP